MSCPTRPAPCSRNSRGMRSMRRSLLSMSIQSTLSLRGSEARLLPILRYKDRANVDAFVAQAAAYDEVAGASRTGRMVQRQQLAGATHPLPILRGAARELERWAASPEYARLLARGTPRRVAPSEVGLKVLD